LKQIHLTENQAYKCVEALANPYWMATDKVGGVDTAKRVKIKFMKALGVWKEKSGEPYEIIREVELTERQARTVMIALGGYCPSTFKPIDRVAENAQKKILNNLTDEGLRVKIG